MSSAFKGVQLSSKRGERTVGESLVIVNVKFNEVDGTYAGMPCSVRASLSSLEKLETSHEECVPKILISGMHYPSLQSIKLYGMEKLEEVDLRMVKTLNCLEIAYCENLKSVSGISDLAKLVKLEIICCGKLKFESLCLKEMKCLEMIVLDRNIVVKCLELNGCEKLKMAEFCFEKVVDLKIQSCPELKKMAALIGPSCLERIIIDGCGIQELQLHSCQNLRSLSTNFQFKVVDIYQCPEQSVVRLSSWELTAIGSCEKLESIADIAELSRLEWMKLRYCSNALTRNCIHTLKSMPSGGLDMIGRAVDGAESRLNEDLFYEANIGVDRVIQIGCDKNHPKWSELSAIIVCFVVVVDSSTSVEDINISLPDFYGLKGEGEWIITMVTGHDWRHSYYMTARIADFFTSKGVMKKGFRVEVKKGEEWKSVGLLHTIVDRLHY
ncbi:hypothetical protein SUGI_0094870 [Cryptomeria japonica]|nr:hypothetical protein SUGI_0094860 [Cryptomeria japonica]GLJ08735.1 hypothetical protein SUGI_0094870 [Cryptomeria japonica]